MAKTTFNAGNEDRDDRAALLRGSAVEPEDVDYEMRHPGQRFAHEAKESGKSLLDSQKRAAADSLDGWAQALRKTAEQLQNDDSSVAMIAQRAAEGIAGFSGSLRQRDVGTLFSQAQDFARRRPAIFLGSALATGFVLARFLKSSNEREGSWEVQMGRNVTTAGDQFPQSPDPTPGENHES
ncbi:MAG: hypothetical protein ACREV9_07850 [Burkholderiales bacterium]